MAFEGISFPFTGGLGGISENPENGLRESGRTGTRTQDFVLIEL